MKKGFGLIEVLIAAVVLGFLVIGLNKLQLGNREGVLRVRARDAASFVAQHVLDSLGAVGINSIQEEEKEECDKKILVYCEKNYTYDFEGNSGNIKTKIDYNVEVELVPNSEQKTADKTNYQTSEELKSVYAKSLQATVKWKYKESVQSIQVAKVVR